MTKRLLEPDLRRGDSGRPAVPEIRCFDWWFPDCCGLPFVESVGQQWATCLQSSVTRMLDSDHLPLTQRILANSWWGTSRRLRLCPSRRVCTDWIRVFFCMETRDFQKEVKDIPWISSLRALSALLSVAVPLHYVHFSFVECRAASRLGSAAQVKQHPLCFSVQTDRGEAVSLDSSCS